MADLRPLAGSDGSRRERGWAGGDVNKERRLGRGAWQGVVLDQQLRWDQSGFAFGFAVTVFVQTLFERKLVGRPGLEPGTTGLKVRLATYRRQSPPSEYSRHQQVTLIRSIR